MNSDNLKFLGRMNPQRLTSMQEDFDKDRAEFQKDELDRALRRAGKLKSEPLETSYERFHEES